MGDQYTPVNGDRVRVVLEGEVRLAGDGDGGFFVAHNFVNPEREHVVSIEKVEPPVVTFKPGDTVRVKSRPSFYSIGDGGYFSHQSRSWHTSGLRFTSEQYELVELR